MKIINLSFLKKIPLTCIFELTYNCNLHCLHCYVVPKKCKELNTEKIKEIILQLKKAGTLILSFSGGEILTRPDFWEIASYASSLNFALNLYTNGTLITQEVVSKIKKLLIYQVHISIYSSISSIHDKITRCNGSFEKSIEAITLLRQNKIKVKIKTPLMKQNIEEVDKIIDLAKKLDTTYLLDPTLTSCQNGEKTPLKWRVGKKDLMKFYTNPNIIPKKGANVFYDKQQDYPCSAGHNFCSISPYGDVYSCLQIPLKSGNLKNKTFFDIWHHSPVFKKIRNITTNKLSQCKDCKYLFVCSRCAGLAYTEDGDILGPSKRACEVAKIKWQIKQEKNGN
ncbi:MAG: radical SAM protein [bacterium]